MGMKALSLWQPWASVIFEFDHFGVPIKPDETRGWPTKVRGRVAIHASKRDDREIRNNYELRLAPYGLRWSRLAFGSVLGTVEIVDCVAAHEVAVKREDWQLIWGDYRIFGDDGKRRFAFVLRDPVKFKAPVPWTGRQGFFNIPDEVIRAAGEQI